MSLVTLIHPAKAIGRNEITEMPFDRNTSVVPGNILLDRGPDPPQVGHYLGLEPPVCSDATYHQISLALVTTTTTATATAATTTTTTTTTTVVVVVVAAAAVVIIILIYVIFSACWCYLGDRKGILVYKAVKIKTKTKVVVVVVVVVAAAAAAAATAVISLV